MPTYFLCQPPPTTKKKKKRNKFPQELLKLSFTGGILVDVVHEGINIPHAYFVIRWPI